VLEKIDTRCCEHDVVDVEQEVDGAIATMIDEQGQVRLGLNEAKGSQVGSEATVLDLWRLLEAIHGAVQSTEQIGMSGVDEAGGLAIVDGLC
jgi:hypothetical protein